MTEDMRWFRADGEFIGSEIATEIADLESTLTSVDGTDPDFIFTDTAQIGPTDHTGSWILFTDLLNENTAREIAAFNTGTGEFTLAQALPQDAVSGDAYQIFSPNGWFSSVSNLECLNRLQKSRLLFPSNETGGAINNFRTYVVPLIAGPLICEIAMGNQAASPAAVTGMATENDEPNLGQDSNFNDPVLNLVERFFRDRSFSGAEFGAPVSYDDIPSTVAESMYVKLSFLPGVPIPLAARAVFQVFLDNTTTAGSFLVVIDVLGADEEFFLGPDRALRLAGGARILGRVRSASTGVLIPNKTINIELLSGPGTLGPQSAIVTGDSGNPLYAVYLSPTDEGEVGNSVTFRVEAN